MSHFEFSDLNISAILRHRKLPIFLQVDINGTYIQLKGLVPIPPASGQTEAPPFDNMHRTCIKSAHVHPTLNTPKNALNNPSGHCLAIYIDCRQCLDIAQKISYTSINNS